MGSQLSCLEVVLMDPSRPTPDRTTGYPSRPTTADPSRPTPDRTTGYPSRPTTEDPTRPTPDRLTGFPTRPSTEDPTRPHCPTNYTWNSVDVRNASDGPGKGSIRQLNSIDNISTCAGYCNANSICCSFEYRLRRE